MAKSEHLAWLREGVEAWNQRRSSHHFAADLRKANLRKASLMRASLEGADFWKANLREASLAGAKFWQANLTEADLWRANLAEANLWQANLTGANLTGAILTGANLTGAILTKANLTGAILEGANLWQADLRGADLRGASLSRADLREADLRGADLTGADLSLAMLVETNLQGANLTGCRVYGLSAWNLHLDEHTRQANLVITRHEEPKLSVDRLEIAQFVYLLLTSPKLRDIIDTLTTKVVLILGRFTEERLAVLEGIRTALREHGYVPMLFDFAGPENQNVLETVQTVARLARFVVADITDAKAVDQELQAILPHIQVPVRPLMLAGAEAPGETFKALWALHPHLLKVHRYRDLDSLRTSFHETVIVAAETSARELKARGRDDIFE